MTKSQKDHIIDVGADNVEQTGFFCYMSKRKAVGFRSKLSWLKARFAEGLRIKMFQLPERGFIEYMPGEYAWRAVHAEGYMLIHCLWIVGKSKGKGLSSLLLSECLDDARASGMRGVAMVTSEKVWLAGKKVLLKHGFVSVAEAPPAFNLMVKKFHKGSSPSFTGNWDEKARRFGRGLTVIRTPQCPYIPDATAIVSETAHKLGIQSRTAELQSAEDVREKAPSAYGVFSIIHNGRLLSYHYLLPKDLIKALHEIQR